MFDLGFEIWIQPALFALLGAYTIYSLLRGFSKGTVTRDGHELGTVSYDTSVIKGTAVKLAAGLLALAGLVVTPPGHRGVIYSAIGGVSDNARPVGMSFIVPLAQSAVMMDVRSQALSTIGDDGKANGFIQTQDLQEVTVRATVRYHVDPNQAAILFNTVGKEYAPILIRPALYDAVKEAGGKVKAEDFAQNLQILDSDMADIIRDEISEHGIIIESVLVEDAIFDPDFIFSVKQKVIEEQVRDKALIGVDTEKFLLEQAAVREQQKVVAAEAEQEAIALIQQALDSSPEYINWFRLRQWNGALPSTLVGDAGDFSLLLSPSRGPVE